MKELRDNKTESKKKPRKPSEEEANAFYTYIVECGDGSLYTGWTNHLEARMKSHNTGKGAKYTRSRLPVRLVYYETFFTKQDAMKREYAIKQLARKDKLHLIEKQSMNTRARCRKIVRQMEEGENC